MTHNNSLQRTPFSSLRSLNGAELNHYIINNNELSVLTTYIR